MNETPADARPRVSVLMCAYDGVDSAELQQAVDSILAQTYRDFEFLVLLDGVQRGELRELLHGIAAADARLRLMECADRRGLAHGLNRLLEKARGEYLARMDADDISLPERLARQVNYLDRHPDVELLGTFAREIDEQGNELFEKRMPIDPISVRRFLSRRDPFIHPTVMFRRTLFARVGPYSESPRDRLLEDTELWSRALLAGCAGANLPEFLFLFRMNSAMLGRRRGLSVACREAAIRLHYAWKARLPIWHWAFPCLVGLFRIAPAWLVRWGYRRLR